MKYLVCFAYLLLRRRSFWYNYDQTLMQGCRIWIPLKLIDMFSTFVVMLLSYGLRNHCLAMILCLKVFDNIICPTMTNREGLSYYLHPQHQTERFGAINHTRQDNLELLTIYIQPNLMRVSPPSCESRKHRNRCLIWCIPVLMNSSLCSWCATGAAYEGLLSWLVPAAKIMQLKSDCKKYIDSNDFIIWISYNNQLLNIPEHLCSLSVCMWNALLTSNTMISVILAVPWFQAVN